MEADVSSVSWGDVDIDDFSSLADVHHLHSDRSTSTASDVHGWVGRESHGNVAIYVRPKHARIAIYNIHSHANIHDC